MRAEEFRVLRIDGAQVSWSQNIDRDRPIILTFGFAAGEANSSVGGNCGPIRSFDELLSRSRLSHVDLQRAVSRALTRWSDAVNVTFMPALEGEKPQVLFGAQAIPSGIAYTSLELSPAEGAAPRSILSSTVCLNPERNWKIGFNGDLTSFDLEYVFAHEIGHVLGLDHPGPKGHIMAFRYLESRTQLSDGDITGAASIYGMRSEQRRVALE